MSIARCQLYTSSMEIPGWLFHANMMSFRERFSSQRTLAWGDRPGSRLNMYSVTSRSAEFPTWFLGSGILIPNRAADLEDRRYSPEPAGDKADTFKVRKNIQPGFIPYNGEVNNKIIAAKALRFTVQNFQTYISDDETKLDPALQDRQLGDCLSTCMLRRRPLSEVDGVVLDQFIVARKARPALIRSKVNKELVYDAICKKPLKDLISCTSDGQVIWN
jgi:hypothetical protein